MASASSTNAFLQACGLSASLELEIVQPDRTVRKSKIGPFAVVGRGKRVDLRLEQEAVSERHAVLQVIDGQLFCCDLESATGTHWPEGAQASGWVEPGEGVQIGPFG